MLRIVPDESCSRNVIEGSGFRDINPARTHWHTFILLHLFALHFSSNRISVALIRVLKSTYVDITAQHCKLVSAASVWVEHRLTCCIGTGRTRQVYWKHVALLGPQ